MKSISEVYVNMIYSSIMDYNNFTHSPNHMPPMTRILGSAITGGMMPRRFDRLYVLDNIGREHILSAADQDDSYNKLNWILLLDIKDIQRFIVSLPLNNNYDTSIMIRYILYRVNNCDIINQANLTEVLETLTYLFHTQLDDLLEYSGLFGDNWNIYGEGIEDGMLHPVHIFKTLIATLLRGTDYDVIWSENMLEDNLHVIGTTSYFEHVIVL